MKDIERCAIEAARIGGKAAAPLLGKTSVRRKGSSFNLVTGADRKAEELIIGFLSREMPGCAILAEESRSHTDLAAPRLWILDPLDGTTNFVHAIPHFGVSVAFAEHGIITAGAVFDPMRDELFSAFRRRGACLNGSRIRVSKSRTLSRSLIATGFYYDRDQTMEKTLRALYWLYKEDIRCIRRMGSASLDLSWLSCGRFDGYFEYTLSPWDFAAGLLILLEAGGAASGSDGTPASLFSKGLICSNGLVQKKLLSCVLEPEKF